MEKLNSVPSIWTDNKRKEWVRTEDDVKTSVELPRLRGGFASDVDVYSLAWNWPGFFERVLFFGGLGCQVGVAATSAIMISRTVRERFYLGGNLANFTSAYATTSVAVILTAASNNLITVNPLFYDESDRICFSCIQLKQTLANLGVSIVLPSVMLLTESLYFILRDPTSTANLPRLTDMKGVSLFLRQKYGGTTIRRIGVLSLANVLMTGLATYMQMKSAVRISLSVDDDPTLLSSSRETSRTEVMGRIRQWVGDLFSKMQK